MSIFDKEKIRQNRRTVADYTGLFDVFNIILGIIIIICSMIIFVDAKEYEELFAIVFLLSGIMNLIMGIKYFKRSEIIKSIAMFIATFVLVTIGIVCFIAL